MKRDVLYTLSGIAVLSLILMGLSTETARAESLWKKGSGSLFSDQKAKAVGDLVTILITESSRSTQQATTSVTKVEKTEVERGIGPILNLLPRLAFGASGNSAAQGSTTRSSNFTARITAKVVEVKPNGTLVIEGARHIGTNNDVQALKIVGVIRPKDITPENTILSTYIADARIDITGKGPISERQKPGIITRLFRLIF